MFLLLTGDVNAETKIYCDCVYGERQAIDVSTGAVLSTDESLINKKNDVFFYIDEQNKKIYDSGKKILKTTSFNENEIKVFHVVNLDSSLSNAEIWNINRNNGYVEGFIVFEYMNKGKLERNTTAIYGMCEKAKENKF